jgi:hypothetical protein
LSLLEIPASQLANYEKMSPNLRMLQQLHERGVAAPQVINPNRRVDQHD